MRKLHKTVKIYTYVYMRNEFVALVMNVKKIFGPEILRAGL